MALLYPSLAIVGGFIALVWGADRFVAGAAATARNLGIPPLIIGLTIVGFGTSAPELLVSSIAAHEGAPGLSVGNAIGSNVTNIALVLGTAAIVTPVLVHQRVLRRDLPMMIGVMVLAWALVFDQHLGRVDGIILLSGLALMIALVVREGIRGRKTDDVPEELLDEMPDPMSTPMAFFWLIVGLGVLLASSKGLVWGATTVARHFDVPELVIGLTIVAFGTSLPELAATVVAARRNEHDIAVGNIVGSNMFNTLGVLGLPGVIHPDHVEAGVIHRDFPVMLGISVLLFVLARALRPYRKLSRWQGGVLVTCFVSYLVLLYMQNVGFPA